MKPQDLPHFGVRNGLVRKGRVVTNPVPEDQRDATIRDLSARHFNGQAFVSVREAKRFMRTGQR